ncbi:hypothetical protein [Treponema sp.]|uniref:hypothetical protein n=1 Tax=Treponema sp. TaxID=166 RepID=UPI0025F5030B|nr:hypothetical protein [Treponema sp.]MCR5218805.1 hypothetical protein [Treponema sp.]
MKKLLSILVAAAVTFNAFALDMPFFNGYAGLLGNMTGKSSSDSYDPDIDIEAFFSGQLDFGGKFLARGEFYISSEDLLQNDLFEESEVNNAVFKIEELSATYKMSTLSSSHYFSAFLGNFEPIGSDIFLQRQFGIQPVTSRFTASWHSLSGASVYPFYGSGISYVYHPESSGAFGLYAYMNKQTEEDETKNVLNLDLRLAKLFSNLTADISAGFGFPIEDTDENGNKVFLLIKEIQLHAGFNFLLGNRYTTSFFMQGGFNKFVLTSDNDTSHKITFSDLYFLIEPRLTLRLFQLNIAAFNIPSESAEHMIYLKRAIDEDDTITNLLGLNANIVTDHLYLGNTNVTFGIHSTLILTDSDIEELKDDPKVVLDWNYEIYVTPYVTIPVLGGSMNANLAASILDFKDDWKSALDFSLGFKTRF